MFHGPRGKKANAAQILLEKFLKHAKFNQNLKYCKFLRCSQAVQMHLAGRMQPAGHLFPTPDLSYCIVYSQTPFTKASFKASKLGKISIVNWVNVKKYPV
jgi:hypothetical protein